MTTLADITYRAAQLVTDMLQSVATSGSATTLVDTANLLQQNQWWDRGTVWIRSGTHSGKVRVVSDFAQNTLTIPTLTTTPGTPAYGVIRSTYPWYQLVAAVRQALSDTFIVTEAVSNPAADIVGDGEECIFTIPTGYSNVVKVELEDPNDDNNISPSNHWREDGGNLVFAYGYAPDDDWIIHIYCKAPHPELDDDTDSLNVQINDEWLVWKTAEYLLYWAVGQYGSAAEYRIEERLNRVLAKLKTLYPRRPVITIWTGGSGGW